jgi:hypothetical protein
MGHVVLWEILREKNSNKKPKKGKIVDSMSIVFGPP